MSTQITVKNFLSQEIIDNLDMHMVYALITSRKSFCIGKNGEIITRGEDIDRRKEYIDIQSDDYRLDSEGVIYSDEIERDEFGNPIKLRKLCEIKQLRCGEEFAGYVDITEKRPTLFGSYVECYYAALKKKYQVKQAFIDAFVNGTLNYCEYYLLSVID